MSICHNRVVHETFLTVARRKSIHVAMGTSYVSLLSLHKLTAFAKVNISQRFLQFTLFKSRP